MRVLINSPREQLYPGNNMLSNRKESLDCEMTGPPHLFDCSQLKATCGTLKATAASLWSLSEIMFVSKTHPP